MLINREERPTFWDRFYGLCLQNNIKPNPLAAEIGVSSATVTKWKKGTTPNGDTLCKLADRLDCTVDYLLGRTETCAPLSREEQMLLHAFREGDAPLQVAAFGGGIKIKKDEVSPEEAAFGKLDEIFPKKEQNK